MKENYNAINEIVRRIGGECAAYATISLFPIVL